MATCSAAENIVDTLKDSWDMDFECSDSDIEKLAEKIAKNLGIEYQRFPKWD